MEQWLSQEFTFAIVEIRPVKNSDTGKIGEIQWDPDHAQTVVRKRRFQTPIASSVRSRFRR